MEESADVMIVLTKAITLSANIVQQGDNHASKHKKTKTQLQEFATVATQIASEINKILARYKDQKQEKINNKRKRVESPRSIAGSDLSQGTIDGSSPKRACEHEGNTPIRSTIHLNQESNYLALEEKLIRIEEVLAKHLPYITETTKTIEETIAKQLPCVFSETTTKIEKLGSEISQTYAAITSKKVPKEPRIKLIPRKNVGKTMVIEDKDGKRDGAALRKVVESVEEIKASTYRVDTKVRGKKLYLTPNDFDKDSDIFLKLIKDRSLLVTVLTEEPRYKLFKVPITVAKDAIVEQIKIQNKENFAGDLRVIHERVNKNKTTKTVTLEAHYAGVVFEEATLFLGAEELRAVFDDRLVQCWTCRKLGHTSNKCRDSEEWRKAADESRQAGLELPPRPSIMCPRCGERHPKGFVCVNPLRCTNCHRENGFGSKRGAGYEPLSTDHLSDDFKRCHIARRKREEFRRKFYEKVTKV